MFSVADLPLSLSLCVCVCLSVCNALTLKVYFWYAVTSPQYLAQVRISSLSDQGQVTGAQEAQLLQR